MLCCTAVGFCRAGSRSGSAWDRAGGLIAPAALAQAQNLGQRTVSGTVLDDAPPGCARRHGLSQESENQGNPQLYLDHERPFPFAQVNMAEDYDLWAEKSGKKSAYKTVAPGIRARSLMTDLKLK